MSGDRIKLEVREREDRGSRHSRRLRAEGVIPGVLYGNGEPKAIAVPERALRNAMTGPSGLHAILDVVLEGQKTVHPSILAEYQQDPVRGTIAHIDLREVRLDQPIQASVVVHLVGEAAGAKEGGVVSLVQRELNVEALPMDIPEHIDVDVVLEGQKTVHPSILAEYQQDPVRGTIAHIDLREVRLDQPIQASVVVHLVGEAAGAKEGGVVSLVQRELNVEALPMSIPEHIDVDVTAMEIGDVLRLEDIKAPEGSTFLDDPHETVIVSVTMSRAFAELEQAEAEAAAEAEAEAAAEAGEEPEEGEEAAPADEAAEGEEAPEADEE